jgi:cysteine synthase A
MPSLRVTLMISGNVLETIGNTPIVQLRKVVPTDCGRVLVKVEGVNPTGSMKDRMAQAMIARAEEDGRLKQGYTVVEYSGGSTGASLALVCGAKGYPLKIFSSDAFAEEKLAQMAAFGAEVVILPTADGLTTRSVINRMIAAARDASRNPSTFWTDQLNNADSVTGYYPLGEEIWEQTGGQVDAFVQSVGTTASLTGVTTVLRKQNPELLAIAVEPAESAVLSGGEPGGHRIEGIGIGRIPPMWKPELADQIISVSTADAERMALRLAREEGLFAGTSSGANVIAAIAVARRLGPGSTVASLLVDSGLKYLQTFGGTVKAQGLLRFDDAAHRS